MCPSLFLPLAALAVLGSSGAAAPAPTVALLPFENLSASSGAPAELSPLVAAGLRAKGWTVVEGPAIESALDAARVRYVDSLGPAARTQIAATAAASALALGAVYAFDEGADPRVSVALRLVSADGRVLFSDLVALRGADGRGLFESDRVVTRGELSREAARRLCRRLPSPGAPAVSPGNRARPLHAARVRTFRAAALDRGSRHRVAILPFANAGPHEAARIVAEILARRLASSALFDPVEPADFRAAIIEEKIRDLSDPAALSRLGARLGTPLFLTGTIYEFAEPAQALSGTPRLEMEATLTDVSTGRVVWTSYASRRGTDYRGLLELGAITSVIGLADQSAAEMVRAAEKAAPTNEPPAPRTASSGAKRKDSR